VRAFLYLRVSTAEQAGSGLGLDGQRSALLAEADRRGWDVVEVIEDAGYSARSMKRPGLIGALARLKAGEADVLAVAKIDRLSRSLADYASMMATAQREGWAVAALDSPADMTSASGEAMAGVLMVFAQMERRLVSDRTKAALAAKRARGERLGRARLVPPEVEARARELRASGLTQRAVGEALTAEGHAGPTGGPWHPATLHRMLTRV
jgi:DNA invertase Pin-like site-specific DNA recombinase